MALPGVLVLTSAVCWGQNVAGPSSPPELVVQTGHSDVVGGVAFSPDGKLLASASRDHTIKLWEVVSGIELRTLRGHSSGVNSVAFSGDGKLLASGSDDKTIKLWDVGAGSELRTLKGHSGDIRSVAFSPDGMLLASGGGWDKTIKLWDVASGNELRTLHPSDIVYAVAFSPDGKFLVSGTEARDIKLWEVSSGSELRTLKGSHYGVQSVVFSRDGKLLASEGRDNTIALWDMASASELRTFKGHSLGGIQMVFSPDGTLLASGSRDETIKLWDVASGSELRTLKGHSGWVTSVAFSRDGRFLASGSVDHSIRVWQVSNGGQLHTLKGRSSWIISAKFSPDGKLLAGGSSGQGIKLWGLASGSELRMLEHSDVVISVAFSPDGKLLASGSEDETIKLWDVSSGSELRTLKGHSNDVNSVTFSRDGKLLASGSKDKTVKLWDVATGSELRTVGEHSEQVISVAFSPDGKLLASGGFDGTIKLWNLSRKSELRTLGTDSREVISVVFSPDGKLLASAGRDKTIKLWDVASGSELRTLKGHAGDVKSVTFSPDGRLLASGSADKTIKLWDVGAGSELRTLEGHSFDVLSVAFSPDGEYLVSGSLDTTIRVWETNSGNDLVRLIALDQNDWLVIDPSGRFDGSPIAWQKILWRFNNNTFDYAPVEVFFSEFYYPGLLTDIFAGKRPKAVADIAQKDRRQPHVKLTVSSEAKLDPRNTVVRIEVTDAPAGAQDVRLFRNGSLVKVWRGDVLKGQKSVTLEATIPIVAGENNLTAYAFNRDNIKSTDATLTITGAESLKRAGTLYVVGVGVNNYENKAFNLTYAVPDAQDFSAELKKQQEKLKNYERTEIIPLHNELATKQKILEALTELAGKVQPEDAVVVYFAGHGTIGSCLSEANQQVNAKDRFYLVPHDLGYKGAIPERCEQPILDEVAKHSISDLELESLFEKIDAGQLLLVIDACNSGQALESEEKRRGPMNSKGLAQLAYEKGIYILTAAQSLQEAKADKKIARGHGYLTYALVTEAIQQKKAADKEGKVVLREWVDYAVQRVPRMQQAEAAERRRFVKKPGEKPAALTGDEEIQTPRVFYRREPDVKPFVVARP